MSTTAHSQSWAEYLQEVARTRNPLEVLVLQGEWKLLAYREGQFLVKIPLAGEDFFTGIFTRGEIEDYAQDYGWVRSREPQGRSWKSVTAVVIAVSIGEKVDHVNRALRTKSLWPQGRLSDEKIKRIRREAVWAGYFHQAPLPPLKHMKA